MKVLLVGHSFIRRLRRQFNPSLRCDISTMSHADRMAAGQFARYLEVDRHFPQIFTYSEHLNLIQDLNSTLQCITSVRPAVVMMQVASNDISRLSKFAPSAILTLASEVVDYANHLLSLGVQLVIINCVLPRTARISSTPEVFLQNANHFNTIVKNLSESNKFIKYQKLRGYFGPPTTFGNPPEVSSWSADGIHCNKNQAAEQFYRRRLRHALLLHKHLVSGPNSS